jgi:hypothetical protein
LQASPHNVVPGIVNDAALARVNVPGGEAAALLVFAAGQLIENRLPEYIEP